MAEESRRDGPRIAHHFNGGLGSSASLGCRADTQVRPYKRSSASLASPVQEDPGPTALCAIGLEVCLLISKCQPKEIAGNRGGSRSATRGLASARVKTRNTPPARDSQGSQSTAVQTGKSSLADRSRNSVSSQPEGRIASGFNRLRKERFSPGFPEMQHPVFVLWNLNR